MNRTQALERVDEILDLFAEMYASGSCPRCGVRLYLDEDAHLPPKTCATRRIVHGRSCELRGSTEELRMLASRFAIRLEPALMAVPEIEAWVLTVTRARDYEGDGGDRSRFPSPDDFGDVRRRRHRRRTPWQS